MDSTTTDSDPDPHHWNKPFYLVLGHDLLWSSLLATVTSTILLSDEGVISTLYMFTILCFKPSREVPIGSYMIF
jgi:hypothetical protein